VEVRPIYSKFYPDEELVFVQVVARYFDGGRGNFLSEARNYIFHPRQEFLIRSIGGGRSGESGREGKRGKDGADGQNGSNGRPGAAGAPGKAGEVRWSAISAGG
jgi:hypothetical protein